MSVECEGRPIVGTLELSPAAAAAARQQPSSEPECRLSIPGRSGSSGARYDVAGSGWPEAREAHDAFAGAMAATGNEGQQLAMPAGDGMTMAGRRPAAGVSSAAAALQADRAAAAELKNHAPTSAATTAAPAASTHLAGDAACSSNSLRPEAAGQELGGRPLTAGLPAAPAAGAFWPAVAAAAAAAFGPTVLVPVQLGEEEVEVGEKVSTDTQPTATGLSALLTAGLDGFAEEAGEAAAAAAAAGGGVGGFQGATD